MFGFCVCVFDSTLIRDTQVTVSGSIILYRCICGLLKNKTRILVTHQLQHLQAADQIVILKEVCVPAEENFLPFSSFLIQTFHTST